MVFTVHLSVNYRPLRGSPELQLLLISIRIIGLRKKVG